MAADTLQDSPPCENPWVGTYPWSVPVAEFLTEIIHELSPSDFARFRRTEPGSPGAKYTYFARCCETGNIKIGRSISPKARMVQIKQATGKAHELLATIRGGENESAYHVAFFPLRLYGEWFPPHPDILAEIARLTGESIPPNAYAAPGNCTHPSHTEGAA